MHAGLSARTLRISPPSPSPSPSPSLCPTQARAGQGRAGAIPTQPPRRTFPSRCTVRTPTRKTTGRGPSSTTSPAPAWADKEEKDDEEDEEDDEDDEEDVDVEGPPEEEDDAEDAVSFSSPSPSPSFFVLTVFVPFILVRPLLLVLLVRLLCSLLLVPPPRPLPCRPSPSSFRPMHPCSCWVSHTMERGVEIDRQTDREVCRDDRQTACSISLYWPTAFSRKTYVYVCYAVAYVGTFFLRDIVGLRYLAPLLFPIREACPSALSSCIYTYIHMHAGRYR